MITKKYKPQHADDTNVFWVTMTDLMLGLVIVFMLLFVFAIMGYKEQSDQISSQTQQISKLKKKIKTLSKREQVYYARKFSYQIKKELEEKGLELDIDANSAQVKISNVELFDLNSYELSQQGKDYLDTFFPEYINTLLQNEKVRKNLHHIVIEGHTDSHSFYGAKTQEEQFLKNMNLSIMRAKSVADYLFKTNYDKQYTNDLTKLITIEGKSFTEPVLNADNNEDFDASRRVELSLVFKAEE